jgi:hypothetical protein
MGYPIPTYVLCPPIMILTLGPGDKQTSPEYDEGYPPHKNLILPSKIMETRYWIPESQAAGLDRYFKGVENRDELGISDSLSF